MEKKILLGLSLLFLFSLSACSTIQLVSAGPESREALLRERLGRFHKEIYWGALDRAALMVHPEVQQKFHDVYEERREKDKIIDLDVKKVDFSNESKSAEVEVMVRFYQNPTYVVQTRSEKELWGFYSTEGGWMLEDTEIQGAAKTEISTSHGTRESFQSPWK